MPIPLKNLKSLLSRQPLSEFLPYICYEDGIYLTADNGLGFILECTPLPSAGEETLKALRSIYELKFPVDTSIQITTYASPNISQYLKNWAGRRIGYRDNTENRFKGLFRELARSRYQFLIEGTKKSLLSGFGYRIRNFRLFISVKISIKDGGYKEGFTNIKQLKASITQLLQSIGLPTTVLKPAGLIALMYEILQPVHDYKNIPVYDERQEIRKQIIFADNEARVEKDMLVIDNHIFRSMTVKQYPTETYLWNMANMIGDLFQNIKQIETPFLLTLNTIIPDRDVTRKKIELKSGRITYQAAGHMGRIIPRLSMKKQNYDILTCGLEEGAELVKSYLHLTIIAQNEKESTQAVQSAKAIFRSGNFILQEDEFIILPLFLSSLPLGQIPNSANGINRVNTMLSSNIAHITPIQADWKGTGTPTLILSSRRGQLMFVDLFDNRMGNYNAVVAAASGSGKSYFINELAISYLGTGGQVWIIDVGRSYLKLAEVLGGEFVVFSEKSAICLNPFSNIINIDEELSLLKPLLAQMASPSRKITDLENAYLEKSIKKAFEKKGQDTTITDVSICLDELNDDRAKDLCQMLFPYTIEGVYGKFFEGRNNLRFDNPFIVLELEELKSKKDLQGVVLLLLLYNIQQKMYLGDRNKRKIVIIDEAWDLIGEGNTGKFIEGGYRRFRKYGGAAITVTQSIDDFYKISSGEAILANSDFMFFLRQKQESLNALQKDSKIIMNKYLFMMLSSVHTIGGEYSEVFVQTPMGSGIGRLIVDPFSNLLYTTNPQEYAMVKKYTDAGMSVSEAIKKCLER